MTDEMLICLCKDIAVAVARGETGLDLIRLATRAAFEQAAKIAEDFHYKHTGAKSIAAAIRAAAGEGASK